MPTSPSGSLTCLDSQPRADFSSIPDPDLLWVRDSSSEPIVYPDLADGPFIVLMESTVPGRNLGKYDPLTIADQIDEVIQGGRTIHRNGLNQIKIVCSERADANLLITSHELRIAGYKAFLPISMVRKKATIRDIDVRHSPISILNRLDSRSRDIVTSIRRRTDNDGAPLDTVELTMETSSIPSTISLSGFELELFPVIPPPCRCYTCQRFRHISSQCRSSRPCCEFCVGHHHTRDCSHGVRSARCSNCFGDHMASSRVCPIFRYEHEVMRVRYWNNCGFSEAEVTLGERGVLRPPRLADRGPPGVAVSSLGRLSAGSLVGDPAPRPGASDSVVDIARSLLELSQRSDECIKRLMEVRASSQDLEGPPLEVSTNSPGRTSRLP